MLALNSPRFAMPTGTVGDDAVDLDIDLDDLEK
jgi:hypothetical protein